MRHLPVPRGGRATGSKLFARLCSTKDVMGHMCMQEEDSSTEGNPDHNYRRCGNPETRRLASNGGEARPRAFVSSPVNP